MIILSIKIAVISILYLVVLPQEKPFNKWYLWGYKWLNNTWLYKPIFVCEKCFAGQISLWYYLVFHVEHIKRFTFRFVDYSFLDHIFFVALTVITSFTFATIYKLIERANR